MLFAFVWRLTRGKLPDELFKVEITMPPVVKVSACSGILLWVAMFAMFGINLMTVPPESKSLPDAQFDKVALPIGLALSFAGIAVSAGMLSARVWAYHIFVASIGLVAIPVGLVALLGMKLTPATAGVGILCSLAMLLRRVLVGKQVRAFFGLAPMHRHLLLVPGWLSLGMGVLTLSLLFWPQPTPMFGVWLQRWQELIINFAFGVGSLTLGWGMLKARRWIWPMAIILALGSLLYSGGLAWDPNPQTRLGPEEAMTRESVFKGVVLNLVWSWWSLRRIGLHRRDSIASDTG
jgi:hypothetical protein